MAKVVRNGDRRRGKMACVSLFLVVLLAGSCFQEASAQAAPALGSFDWMGLLSRLLQNTVLGPFVTAINAVSGGVPNLNQAVLGLTGNIANATQLASGQLAASGFGGSTPGSPAVFRRDVQVSSEEPAAAAAAEHQTPPTKSAEEVHHPHDLFSEVALPQHADAARAASFNFSSGHEELSRDGATNSSASAHFGSGAYHAGEEQPPRDAADIDSEQEEGLSARSHDNDWDDDDSSEVNSAHHLKGAAAHSVNASAPVDHARAEQDAADADEATVSDADDQDDAADYAATAPVHARMVFKRSAAKNASAVDPAHGQQARADPPAATGLLGANNPLFANALGANQAVNNLAAGTVAAQQNILATSTNALNALGLQQANLLADNTAALNSQLQAQKVALGADKVADKVALEDQKVADKVAEKGPAQGNEIPFPPAPQTTPKPVVYYTPSPKFYAVKPVYAAQRRPVVGGKPC